MLYQLSYARVEPNLAVPGRGASDRAVHYEPSRPRASITAVI